MSQPRLGSFSPGAPTSKPLGHVPALDGLRAVAVLGVFFFHVGIPAFSGAFLGVDIFFVLSGFLITTLIIEEYEACGRIGFARFYLRRVLRLMPALFFFLAIFLLFFRWYFAGDPFQQARQAQDVLLVLFYAANWTRAFGLGRPQFLGHCWSLSLEEQFYLVWPLLLGLLLRLRPALRSRGIAGLFLLSWGWRLWLLHSGASWDRVYNDSGSRADMLLAGCLLASLRQQGFFSGQASKIPWFRILGPAAAALLGWLMLVANWQKASLYVWQYGLVALGVCLLLLALLTEPRSFLSRLLGATPMVWLGERSYGFYLWHYPLILLFGGRGLGPVSLAACAGVLTMAFACLSRRFVETPALALKKRFRAGKGWECAGNKEKA